MSENQGIAPLFVQYSAVVYQILRNLTMNTNKSFSPKENIGYLNENPN